MNTGENTDIQKSGNEYGISTKQLRKMIYLGCFFIYNSQLVHIYFLAEHTFGEKMYKK